jgi:hypothetical protein
VSQISLIFSLFNEKLKAGILLGDVLLHKSNPMEEWMPLLAGSERTVFAEVRLERVGPWRGYTGHRRLDPGF